MGESASELYRRGVDAANAQRYATARRLLARAAERADDEGDADLRARIAGTTAYALAQTGEPARAEELCREALRREGLSAETTAILAGQLGVLFTRAGRLDEADEMLSRAIDALDDGSVATATCLLNRSLVHMQRRTLDACTADLERAMRIYAAAGEEGSVAETRHNLGYTALLRGDLVTALDLMARSRPVIAAGSDLSAAISDLDRAEVLRDAGLVEEAERLLEGVARTFGAARMRQARGEAEFHLARSLLRHDPARARRVAQAAARRFRALGSESWAARSDAVRLDAQLAVGGRPPTAAAFDETARVLARAGFPTEALTVRLGGAVAVLRRGGTPGRLPRLGRTAPIPVRLRAAEVRAMRASVGGRPGEARRIAGEGLDLLAGWQRSFGALDLQASLTMHGADLVFLGLAAAVRSGAPAVLFDWSERARHLSQQVAPVRPPHDPALAADLAELRMLRAEITDGEWTDDARVRVLRDRVRERQWTATGAGAARPRLSLDELATALDADTATLSYVFTGAELVCLVTTADDARIVRLSWPGVEAALQGLRADLDVSASVRAGPMAAVVARALDERMRVLDSLLLAPVCAAAGGRRRLAITVPGVLAGVPWGMLPAMAARPFTLATSLTRWLSDRAGGRAARRAGFAAGPRVPRAGAEVAAAAAHWSDPVALTGEAATVTAVTALAGGVDLLHIAAHGRHNADNPLFSGFELADGALFGYDVDLIPATPATVVLSACELGRSSVRWGQEALGMTHVWLHAGTTSVISAPVVIADEVAEVVLAAVHESLARGVAPSDALAAASASTGLATPFQCHGAGF